MKLRNIRKLSKSFVMVGLTLLGTAAFAETNSSWQSPKDVVGCGSATCCGGAWITACADAAPLSEDAFVLTVKIDSNGDCGSNAPAQWQGNVNYGQSFNNQQIYNVDAHGCGGGNWDIGGQVALNDGACEAGVCTYYIDLTSSHGGVGNQCHCTNKTSFQLNVPQP